jgi:dihydroflavonol-4-reductase
VKPTLVTGATGFVGWHVAKTLLDRGQRVRALARDPSRLRELETEPIRGDLRDPESIQRAVGGCGVVYHVAADYRLWAKDPSELYESNVEGTRNLLTAATKAGVERVVYTSTVGCIGIPNNGVGNEDLPVSLKEISGAYKRSKFLAEQVALEFARKGLPLVVVNPTAPIGDHDFKPTPTGKIVVDFLRRRMPAYVETGLNLVDVRDVAEGHVLACERGAQGNRYVLGAENLTLRQIFETLEVISGLRAPAVRLPYAVAYAAGIVSTAWAHISGAEPRAPIDGVKMARKKMWVTHEKAVQELGYRPGSAATALHRAVQWFQANGYV